MGYRLRIPFLRPVCGKVRHYTKVEADVHRDALERWDQTHKPAHPGRLNTYWCSRCAAYHVGHTEREIT
jgi:hypothetical protein